MKIIGIKVLNGVGRAKSSSGVMKALHAGWFPFGNHDEPVRTKDRWEMNTATTMNYELSVF